MSAPVAAIDCGTNSIRLLVTDLDARGTELVLADLRVAFSEHVPGAHILTLADWERLRRLAALWRRAVVLVQESDHGQGHRRQAQP